MFLSSKFIFSKKFYVIFFILFMVFCGVCCAETNTKNYAKCHSIIEINGLASDDYINSKKQTFSIDYLTTSTTDTVSSLNSTYRNFIQTPTDYNSENNNFLFLIVKGKDIKNDLSCGFTDSSMVVCNSSQLWGSGCVEEYEETVNNKVVKTTIETCDVFDKQNTKKVDSACYPKRHICNTYKNNITNKYFSIQGSKMPDAIDGKFYIYTKNVVGEPKGSKEKTCDFEILPCDLKIKNEATIGGFVNVVFKNTSNKYNKKFIENISSGYDESDMFFRYVGTVNKNSTNYNNIMEAPYYYKYVAKDSDGGITDDVVIFYYKKYLTGGTDPKGRICSGYLPNCKYVDPSEESNLALYDRIDDGNKKNRDTFYNSKVSGISLSTIQEEYLWFAANPYSANQVCLSRTGKANNNQTNHDIGYCSDLLDDFSDLKYTQGLQYNEDGTPKCYLKSCIDLTVEELEKIKSKNSSENYKWCSEYYYLESSGGLKYFPKEKPNYCSDLDSDGFLEYRATWEKDGGKYGYCVENGADGGCTKYEYYSYGGGRNSTKSNCYLKNCFSLNDKERQEVADANATNVGFEMEKYADDLSKFNRSNLPKYCDNGFLFNNQMDEFKDFDYLNLNVISCLDFSDEQLNAISAERMILFTDLLGKYDTKSSKVFCRTHYRPLNKSELIDEAKIHNERTNFLETTYIIADESKNIGSQSPYKSLLNAKYGADGYNVNLGTDPFINIPERAKTDYKKVKFSELKKVGVNKYLFSNVCSYVDNSFLYYNADIMDLRYNIAVSDSNAKIAEVINSIQNKNSVAKNYLNCKNKDCNEKGECQSKPYDLNDSNMDDDCKKCNKYRDPLERDKCLVDGGDTCKYYAYDYMCKKEAKCFDDEDKISESLCFLKDNISDYIIDCDQYISMKSTTNIFDCSLFSNTSSVYKDIYENYLNYGDDGLNANDLEEIRKGCNDNLPLTDTRMLPDPDPDSALLKPFKLDQTSFNNSAADSVGKHDFERYGCALYNVPTNVTDVLSAQLWGCKTPDIDSSYISKYTSDFIINNISFKEEFKQPYLSQMVMSVCSRYPEDKYIDNKCGQREGSYYKDKCLELTVDNENVSNSVTLEDTNNGLWYFESASGGSRFRYERHGRDVLVFRDFYTYYKCNASNIDSKYYYYDEESAAIITGEAAALGAIIGVITGGAVCTVLLAAAVLGGWVAYGVCLTAAIAAAIAVSITAMLLSRTEEYNLSLQNNLYYPHEYFGNNEDYGKYGFLIKANITNNDNYIYRYYQRADTIEEDLKNKLESNTDWDENNTRFFFGNTVSKDIIRKCNIQNLFGLTGDCIDAVKSGDIDDNEEQVSYDQVMHCNYQYSFFELEDNGIRKKENGKDKLCELQNNESPEKCLTEKQKKCLAGYGVKFLFNSNIDNEFIMLNGGFLNTYQDGDSVKQNWGTEGASNYNWVPVNIVPYTMDISDKSTLKDRLSCNLMKYGDAYGTLDKCRGFEHNGTFYTESQSVKAPLFTSPMFFYGLITSRNVPELFNPAVVLEYYYLFSKYYNGEVKDSDRNKYEGVLDTLVLDFYNPKVQYYYDFANSDDKQYSNKHKQNNQFIVEIELGEKNGKAHALRYIDNILTQEITYGFVISKSSIKTLHNSYTPQVCLYQIKPINNSESGLNTTIETSYCNEDDCKYRSYTVNDNTGTEDIASCCLEKSSNQSFIVVDNDVECYERAIPFLSDFAFMQSKNIEYNNPVINVYLKPNYKTIQDVVNNKDTYMLKSGDSEDILLNGENYIQSFGLNFERSYCSKAYYDYYQNLDLLEKELNSKNTDLSKVSLYRKNISTIESIVIPDCKKDDGNEIDLLINKDTIKTYNDANGVINNIIAKETVKVRDDNALYGGFNEVCVAQNDIKHILKTYNKQRKTNVALPKVLVYKPIKSTEQRKTKCILDINSMKNNQCMVANKVYVYCTDEEINFGNKCKKKLDITNNKEVYVREVDCLAIKNSINSASSLDFIKSYIDNGNNIKDIQACYKGGFNMLNTVYKNDLTQEHSCSCITISNNSDYSNFKDFVTEREITLREYGLCVDLIKPSICPAVRYFDSQSKYVDDRLALGKTEDELKQMDIKDYEQHLWRTEEKQLGIMPSVFYESSLEHAEFPASVYCGGDRTRYKKRCDCDLIKDKYKKENNNYTEDRSGEYIKINNNYVICTDYCDVYTEDVNGEYIEDKNGNKVKAEEYYKNNCIGGKVQVEGECNGYWKENPRSTPVAVCTKRTNATSGTTIYEYKLLGYGCERYSCPAIGYDSNTNLKNLDERVIEYNDSQLFKESEVKTFSSGVELTDFSSFKHNEELNASSADVRGALNGFAIWGEANINGTMDVISNDYAKVIKSQSCLTGFAPAGTNYRLLHEFNRRTIENYQYYNIYYQSILGDKNNDNTYTDFKMHFSNRNSLVQIYKERKKDYDSFIDLTKTPRRRCNQFGEWMDVDDPYNNVSISSVYGENYYYNSNDNFWKKIYAKSIDDLTNEELVKLGGGNYCERLVCPIISSEGSNYFDTEFIYGNEKATSSSDITSATKSKYYTFWKHSGGAFWDMIGAPRNSSDIIIDNTANVGYGDSSRSINNIFNSTISNELTINNKYKYVKKVYGRCENEYGYYNRNSQFNNKDFSSQYSKLLEVFYLSASNDGEVDPRKEAMLDNSVEITKPSRHCTSIGLWSGVLDPCFRACEMMDIYHTTFNGELYKGQGDTKANIVNNSEYFVENSDIVSIDLAVNNLQIDGKRAKFEERFITLHNPSDLKEYNSFKTGDYLTGGAKWPRSIVRINDTNMEYKLETKGSKAGLRYIEVEAECDSSYDSGDSRIRQFILRSVNKKPKRKCYEDGTWGPVYGDTRCILAKNCVDYSLTLFNLTNLMAMYDQGSSATVINNYIANIPYGANGVIEVNSISDIMKTAIYNFSANNTVVDSSKSYNVIKTNDSSKYLTTIEEGSNLSNCDTVVNSNCIKSSICIITESDETTNMAGWSLNLIGADGSSDTNIGRYFRPTTCNLNNTNDDFYVDLANERGLNNIKELNRLKLVYTPSGNYANKKHYSKESLLNYSYDLLNNGNSGACDVRYPNKTTYNKTEVENESCKGINIGTDYYNSYQIHYECGDDYYNKLVNNDGSGNYYNKHIIFECETQNSSNGKFYYHTETKDNNGGDKEIIRALDCEPITCGGNKYQKDWSTSIIEELNGNSAGIAVNFESTLECPSGTAFVFENKPADTKKLGRVTYYEDRSGKSYAEFNFVSAIHGTCSRQKVDDNFINGTKVGGGISSYDYRRYGEIKLGDLLNTKLCTSIYKTNASCKVVTEAEIFANSSEFLKTYCVPMACPYKNLKFVDGGQDGNDSIEEVSSGFSLPGSTDNRYEFGTNVVIQSMDGDYKNGRTKEYCENWYEMHRDMDNDDCEDYVGAYAGGTVVDRWGIYGALVTDSCMYAVRKQQSETDCKHSDDSRIDSSITIDYNNILYNYGVGGSDTNKQISGNICSTDTDIYTDGGPEKYTLFNYLNAISDNTEKIKANSCFNILSNDNIVKYNNGCQSGYDIINNNICVKYNDYVKSNKTSLEDLVKNIDDFAVTDNHKNNAVDFIVDAIMFNGININKNGDYINNTYTKIFKEENGKWVENDTGINIILTAEADNIINEAKVTAITNTNTYISTSNNFSYKTCKYDNFDWYDNTISNNLVSVEYNNSVHLYNNKLMQKYKEITGVFDGFYEFENSDGEVIVGVLTNNNIDKCNASGTKYTISALATGYYKIKKEAPLCVLESVLEDNVVTIDSVKYIKINGAESCKNTINKDKFSYVFDYEIFGNNETYIDASGLIWTKQSNNELCDNVLNNQVCAITEICPNSNDTSDYKFLSIGTETCSVSGVKVEKLEPIGRCFYNSGGNDIADGIELNMTGAFIDCNNIENCETIVNNQLNSGNNVLSSNVKSGEIDYNNEYWVDSNNKTCDSGYYFTKDKFDINGKGFISLEDYINKYNEEYKNELINKKEELKLKIKNGTAGDTSEVKKAYIDLFDKWTEKYRTEEFMEIENNEILYNRYLEIYQETMDADKTNGISRVVDNEFYSICTGLSKEHISCTNIDYLNNEETCINNDDNNICLNTSTNVVKINNVTTIQSGFINTCDTVDKTNCFNGNYSTCKTNDGVTCINSNDSNTLTEEMCKTSDNKTCDIKTCNTIDGNVCNNDGIVCANNNGNTICVVINKVQKSFEYLEDVKNNINSNDGLINKLQTNINECGQYYIDYYNKKNAYETEQNKKSTAKFNNGLFMVMQCTPNGWMPLTNSSCKTRCKSVKYEGIDLNPQNGSGIFRNVAMFISGMRHSVELNGAVVVHQDSTSSRAHWAAGRYGIKCDNGSYVANGSVRDGNGTPQLISTDKNINNHNYNYFTMGWNLTNIMTSARAYTVCENTYVSTYPQWNQTRGSNDLTTSNFVREVINGKVCRENIEGFDGDGRNTGAQIGCYYCRGGFTQIGFTSYSHIDDASWDYQDYHR